MDKIRRVQEREKVSDEQVKLVIEACLRHGIHHDLQFEEPPRNSRLPCMRERMGIIMNHMMNHDARAELLEKVRSVCGGRMDTPGLTEGEFAHVGRSISVVGGVLRQQAESVTGTVGLLLEQGAGQMRERLGASRAT
jgi:hypothetical protein